MRVKKFDEYVSTVCEHFDADSIKKKDRTKNEIYTGFKNLKYKCLGSFYWKYKNYGNYICEHVKDFLKKFLSPVETEIFGAEVSTFQGLTVEYFSKIYNRDVKKYMYSVSLVSEDMSDEKVVRIYDRDKASDAYVFWNPVKKYYYYMYLDNITGCELFDRYVMLKTEPLYKVKDELKRIKSENDTRENARRTRDEIGRIKSDIIGDYMKNPRGYKGVDGKSGLPDNVRDDMDKPGLDHEYFKAYIQGSHYADDGYGLRVNTETCVINNRDLTDGYVFTYETRRSNYTGD